MNALTEKLREVLVTVLPIMIIVLILHWVLTPLESAMLIRFFTGSGMIILGLAIFLLGVDHGVTPIGKLMGSHLAKTDRVVILVVAGLILGFFVSIAEPDLHILAGQVDQVTGGDVPKMLLVAVVSIGIALLLGLGFLRVVFNLPLYKILTLLYVLIFVLVIFTSDAFTSIAFDASGSTTGAFAVPFILALSVGISSLKKDSKASEKDSFGMVAIVSTGAIMTVLIMGILTDTGELSGNLSIDYGRDSAVLQPFLDETPHLAMEALVALSPLIVLFVAFQLIRFKLKRHAFWRVMLGLLYSLIGLILFLVGVNAGFMALGSRVGYEISSMDSPAYILITAFLLGLVTILAEPAVNVLTHQIEDVTAGSIHRRFILAAFSLGVGMAVSLSILRILVPTLQLWHFLVPGYAIAVGLMYVTPKLFVGIAFDSGGVASGPMTATFILAFIQGAAEATEGANVLIDGFGMIAMVALMPIITIQILGFIYKRKSIKEGV